MIKPALTISEQIALLRDRGLKVVGTDESVLMRLLINNNYYRMSGYWRYFQAAPHHGDNKFRDDATVSAISDVYEFDATLRSILFDGLSMLEVTFRSRFSYFLATTEDPCAYLDLNSYSSETAIINGANTELREVLLRDIGREVERSKEDFIVAHVDRGDGVPVWVAVEALSMGVVSKMYRLSLNDHAKIQLSKSFDHPTPEFTASLVRSFAVLRNICAHQGRIWNRTTVGYPLQVLNALKLDKDKRVYQRTPWAWLVMLAHTVDQVAGNDTFSKELWRHVDAYPEFKAGLTHPHRR